MKNVDFFKNLFSDILSNILATAIIGAIGIGISLIPTYGPILLVLFLIFILYVIIRNFMFGKVSFKWSHYYDEEVCTLEIHPDKKVSYIERFKISKLNNSFDNRIVGEYCWDDLAVTSLKFTSKCNVVVKSNITMSNGSVLESSEKNLLSIKIRYKKIITQSLFQTILMSLLLLLLKQNVMI